MILKEFMQNNTDCRSRTNRLDYSGLDQLFLAAGLCSLADIS